MRQTIPHASNNVSRLNTTRHSSSRQSFVFFIRHMIWESIITYIIGFHEMLKLVRQIFTSIVTRKSTYGYTKLYFLFH